MLAGGCLVLAAPGVAFADDATPGSPELPVVVQDENVAPQPPQAGFSQPRTGSVIAGTPDGNTVVVYGGGGLFDDTGTPLADTWTWDGSSWTPQCGTTTPGADAPCVPGPRNLAAGGTGPDGVVLYGGQTDTGSGPEVAADTWTWDGSSWNLACSSCAPGKRYGAAAAGNGTNVLLFGGLTDLLGVGTLANDTWSFDGTTWNALDGGGAGRPAPRFAASLAWDGQHYVLFGGADFGGGGPDSFDDAWIWTDAGWVQACGSPLEPCGPKGRLLAGFANLANPDPARQGALLGGGISIGATGATVFGDLWFWNGTEFVKQASPWPDETDVSAAPPVGLIALGMLGSRAAACEVTMLAANVIGSDPIDPELTTRTFTLGLDTDGDGKPGPCTAPTATPTADPVADLHGASPLTGSLPVTGTELGHETLAGIFAALVGLTIAYSVRRPRTPLRRESSPRRSA